MDQILPFPKMTEAVQNEIWVKIKRLGEILACEFKFCLQLVAAIHFCHWTFKAFGYCRYGKYYNHVD